MVRPEPFWKLRAGTHIQKLQDSIKPDDIYNVREELHWLLCNIFHSESGELDNLSATERRHKTQAFVAKLLPVFKNRYSQIRLPEGLTCDIVKKSVLEVFTQDELVHNGRKEVSSSGIYLDLFIRLQNELIGHSKPSLTVIARKDGRQKIKDLWEKVNSADFDYRNCVLLTLPIVEAYGFAYTSTVSRRHCDVIDRIWIFFDSIYNMSPAIIGRTKIDYTGNLAQMRDSFRKARSNRQFTAFSITPSHWAENFTQQDDSIFFGQQFFFDSQPSLLAFFD